MPSAPLTVFASKSLREHFARGVIGIACLYLGYKLAGPGQSLAAFGAAIVLFGLSLWALRGCPVCWTVGLINTVAGLLHRKQQAKLSSSEGPLTCSRCEPPAA